jgi:hypothetical protein
MSSLASRRSRDARFESMKRQADRAETLKAERDDLMAALIQAKALLEAGDTDGARNALDVGGSIEPLPRKALDLIGFAADFNALCLKRKVRAAWFTTYPKEDDPTGKMVSVSTGGEAHHDALLGRALDAYANPKRGTLPIGMMLSPDEMEAAFPPPPADAAWPVGMPDSVNITPDPPGNTVGALPREPAP